MSVLTVLSTVASMVTMLVWTYRARRNVEGLGRQRRSPGWAIGGWFCPGVNLWFPLQIILDVGAVDRPPGKARAFPLIAYAWWICWLAAWVCAVQYREVHVRTVRGDTFVNYSVSMYLGGTVLSKVFGAAAAFLLALLVHSVSIRQERRVPA
ncbi:DUF4328 domain-containing protein [Actinocrispum wychmicini]|nr:DUF4328 domain-containing protein [Actinocrispum wychmicini]